MKFSLKHKSLSNLLKIVAKTLNRRPHLPVLAGILLRVSEDSLEITSTDLVVGTKIKVKAEVETQGELVVNGKVFLETMAFFEGETTSFLLKDKTLELKNGKDRISIPVFTDEYPDFKLPKVKTKQVAVELLDKISKKVAFAASSDQTRPALTGVFFRGDKEQMRVVCTDGFRLAVWQIKDKNRMFFEGEMIVSAKAIADIIAICQILKLEEITFAYDQVGEQVIFSSSLFSYFTKTISSNYPPFEKIIPLEFATQLMIDREGLSKSLMKASVFTKADSNTVKMAIGKEWITFQASSQSEGSFLSELKVDSLEGSEVEISFNIRYLQDFLSTVEGETVWFGCNDPATPALLKDVGDETIICIVMPFRLKG